ncbi:MAG: 1-aminocyclopropane-1-carboxylate deaminase/D-cysteine desulfhydrase [Ferruginibacter sp.]
MLPDISKANIEVLHDELFIQKQVTVSVLRLDKIHPVISGNKLFKLHYFLEEALAAKQDTILTFGGAYSNHLAATAFVCKALHLKSIAVVRGEKPAVLSSTLQQCVKNGMKLKFISRELYAQKDQVVLFEELKNELSNCMIVPEGGYAPAGAKGAALIMDLIKYNSYTHICTASGTATTTAGLLLAVKPGQIVVSLPVLKGMTDNKTRIKELTGNTDDFKNLLILDDYHFGGYAKKTSELIDFMNDCWEKYKLPLDFVYTAKMLYGIIDSIKKDRFEKGSKILCVHTGGLQGNKSLPLKSLLF